MGQGLGGPMFSPPSVYIWKLITTGPFSCSIVEVRRVIKTTFQVGMVRSLSYSDHLTRVSSWM